MPEVHTGVRLSSRGHLGSAGENLSGLHSVHLLLRPLHSHALDGQLALVPARLQAHQLAPVHVSLLEDLQGKVSRLELAVKSKLVLRFSIRNLVDPTLEEDIGRYCKD